jgi:hypothetical protein
MTRPSRSIHRSGNRGVKHRDLPGLGAAGEFEHQVTVVSRHIDPGRARPQRVDQARHRRGGLARAEQRGEQYLDLPGQFLSGCGRPGPAPDQVLDPARVKVIDGQVMPGAGQVAGHRAAHGAKPDVSQAHLILRLSCDSNSFSAVARHPLTGGPPASRLA